MIQKVKYYSGTIPICFSTNDYYIPYMSTMIQSVMENSDNNRNYSFFILCNSLEEKNIAHLKDQVSVFPNFSIEFVNVADYLEKYNFFTANRNHISVETFYRLLTPFIFSDYDKIIYLDCDMVCLADIAELYDINIGNKVLISSRDLFGLSLYYKKKKLGIKQYERFEIIKIDNINDYFIPGMLVFNVTEFLSQFSMEDVLELAASRKWPYQDQDILNVLCENKTLLVNASWDFTDIGSDAEYLPTRIREEYLAARANPKIIHFAAWKKPWECAFLIPDFEKFWKYATRTPFIDIIISKAKEKKIVFDDNSSISNYLQDQIQKTDNIVKKSLLSFYNNTYKLAEKILQVVSNYKNNITSF